ncbi:uncharacterized protein LOC134268160 [Saccostrea cucullata]|uniref:uncharacterized protein LOC134268160 n=1 Tax=Saccostrea cuccullata TaxID=36930 RepID=UPI002ED1764E
MRTATKGGMFDNCLVLKNVLKLPFFRKRSVFMIIACWLKAVQPRSEKSSRPTMPPVMPYIMTRSTVEESDASLRSRVSAPVVIFVLAIFVCIGYKKYKKSYREKSTETVKILVQEDENRTKPDYISTLKSFIIRELHLQVEFVTKVRPARKYLLPCKLKNRLPEEIKRKLKDMDFTGKYPPDNVFIVIMHECAKGRELAYARDLENSRLYSEFNWITPVFYEGCLTSNSSLNEKAKEEIQSFLLFQHCK